MTDRPILFSGPMVRAILEGRKTVTRRPVKPQPVGRGDYWDLYCHGPEWAWWLLDNRMSEPRTWVCPYGVPGDLLRVHGTNVVLEVVGVTIERVRDITCLDAQREGFSDTDDGNPDPMFARVWDDIYAARGLGWDANPWVWRIAFRRLV